MNKQLKELSNAIRFLSIDAVQKANSGHPGLPLGMADVVTVLFKYYLKFNPKNPSWINRDRFILSAGHGSMLLYSLLYLTGYKSITLNDKELILPHPDIADRLFVLKPWSDIAPNYKLPDMEKNIYQLMSNMKLDVDVIKLHTSKI